MVAMEHEPAITTMSSMPLSSAVSAPPPLHLALIAPDSLTGYATQLQQALLNILHAQKLHTEQPAVALAETASSSSLPLLDVVSLYIQLPEESTTDFVYRLQQGALPQHLSLPHLSNSRHAEHLQHFDDHDDDDDDDDETEAEDQGQQQQQQQHHHQDEHGDEDEEEGEVRGWHVVDGAIPAYSRQWRSPSDEDSADEQEVQVGAGEELGQSIELEDDTQLPFVPFTPRHLRLHEDTEGGEPATVELLSESESAVDDSFEDEEDEQKAEYADREIALSVLQTVQYGLARLASQQRRDEAEADEAEAEAHSARQSHAPHLDSDPDSHDSPVLSSSAVPVPPLNLSRLLSGGSHHINVLLYDGIREDVCFQYFQFLQQLATQLQHQPLPVLSLSTTTATTPTTSTPSPANYIPPTILLLYNGWQILHRCEQDEETEERIKKLLNLCDVVVVQDEELCAAYRQLCPLVEVIPHGYAWGECECGDEDGEASVAMSPLSSVSSTASTMSLASTASSASSLLFSPVPRAPVSSPACSPPLSPRLSTSPQSSLSSATSAFSSFSSPDIVDAVHRKT